MQTSTQIVCMTRLLLAILGLIGFVGFIAAFLLQNTTLLGVSVIGMALSGAIWISTATSHETWSKDKRREQHKKSGPGGFWHFF